MLQQFRHGFVQILHVLFLVGTWVDRFRRMSSPDQLLRSGVIHIQDKRPDTDCRAGGRAHAAPEASACAPSVPLSFLIDGDLIADIQVGFVTIGFGQTFEASCESTACFSGRQRYKD